MKYTSIPYLITVLLTLTVVMAKPKTTRIIGVVELIRHGARTPSTFMEASAKLYFGARRAQLTINGYRQHVLLGRYLRRQYVHGDRQKLFSKIFNPEEVKIYSSPRQRTIFSATAHIMGLFPKSIPKILFGSKHFKNNDHPPIKKFRVEQKDGKEVKINVFSYRNDYIFHTLKCHRKGNYKKLKEQMKKTPIFILNKTEVSLAVKDILLKYNFMFSKRNSFKTEGEFVEFQKNYKKDVFTKSFFKKLVAFIRPFKYHHDSYSKLLPQNLKTIEKYLLNKWYRRIRNKTNEKMVIFSGHDTNLVNFISNILHPDYLKMKINKSLTNLKDYTFLVPPLASSIVIELHESKKEKNKYFINLIYNGEQINKIRFRKNVKLIKENGLLDYDNFKDLMNSRVDLTYNNLVCGNRLIVK